MKSLGQEWNKDDFEKYISEYMVKELKGYDYEWSEQIKYSILNGGKRFRPALIFNMGIAEIEREILYRLGIAIETLHSATLVHDDLPSIDDDDYRRGKLAAHKVYGEGIALTGGDFMMFFAQKIVSELGMISASEMLAKCAMDTAYGEALDIKFEKESSVPSREILKMYEYKTARFIQFSVCSPLLFSGKDKEIVNTMWEAGRNIGIAFQLLDDYKDVHGTFGELGKTPGKDEKQNKHTIIKNEGIEKSQTLAAEFWDKGFELIGEIEGVWNFEFLKEYLSKSWEIIKKS